VTGAVASAQVRIDLLAQAIAARPQSAELLYQLAEAFAEAGDDDRFAEAYGRAFRLAPAVRPRLDRDPAGVETGSARQLVRRARALAARGVIPAPVIAALAVGAARLGERGEVARLVDYDRFFHCLDLDPPADLAGLAAELGSGLKRVERGAGKAGSGHYRFGVFETGGPACAALGLAIRREVERYVAALPQAADHPFAASRPGRISLEGWAVRSRGDDYFGAHIHPQAWLSGVFYVQQPADAGEGSWLHVGPPAQFGVTQDDGWDMRRIEPRPGRLVLMPGYFYHGTTPTRSDEPRLCVAFNAVAGDIAWPGPGA
jgi:hypothetical protein